LRRSSRITLLVGIFFAVIAFVGIVVLSRPAATPPPVAATTTPTVYAAQDIPIGTRVTKEMVRQEDTKNAERSTAAFQSTTLVIGKTIRRSVVKDTQLTTPDFASAGQIVDTVETPAGLRAIAVQVDQVTGVGTIIKTGDFVDVMVSITGDKMPVYTVDLNRQGTMTDGGDTLNNTTVKILIQGSQVLGTLLPPPAVDARTGAPAATAGTSLTGQQELVILGVTAQQAEIIKFAQLDGSISLLLRSSLDFIDASGKRIDPASAPTTGIVLKTLVDQYGLLVPQIVQTIFLKP
jgi:pilus assembly protein CpaB